MFYIAKAALLNQNIISKTHSGTSNIFSEKFVKSGILDAKYGSMFSKLVEERKDATCNLMEEITFKQAEKAIEMAKEFITEVKKII